MNPPAWLSGDGVKVAANHRAERQEGESYHVRLQCPAVAAACVEVTTRAVRRTVGNGYHAEVQVRWEISGPPGCPPWSREYTATLATPHQDWRKALSAAWKVAKAVADGPGHWVLVKPLGQELTDLALRWNGRPFDLAEG